MVESKDKAVTEKKVDAPKEGTEKKSSVFLILFYLVLWYGLNIGFNIYNKKALNVFKAPWTVATAQLVVGWPIFIPLWILGIRKTPKLTSENLRVLSPNAAMHTLGHVSGVIALGAGAVSFTHIVKAMEPFFTAVLGAAIMGTIMPWQVYAALIPVCAGVGLASLKELSFTWLAFGGAMTSNVACALRGLISKSMMGKVGQNMDASNLFSVLTIYATFLLTPFAAVLEGPTLFATWAKATEETDSQTLMMYIGLSGFFFYTYNEVAFKLLGLVDPITSAVANTIKRVVIIIVSVVVFQTQMTTMGIAGSSLAIGGVLIYSLAKQHYCK